MYLGHTKPFQDLTTNLMKWLLENQVTIMLTPIQDKKAQEICWLLYTTKQLICVDLGTAITIAIGI